MALEPAPFFVSTEGMTWAVLAAIGLAIVLVVLYLVARPRRKPLAPPVEKEPIPLRPNPPAPVTQVETAAQYRVLLTMVLGDRTKAERLIAYEATLAPGAGRAQLVDKAIERMRADQIRYG